MKNNDNFFADFITFAVMAGIKDSFSEKKNTEKSQSETKTTEKKCECGNKCKNTASDSYKDFLLESVEETIEMLMFSEPTTKYDAIRVLTTLYNVREYLS